MANGLESLTQSIPSSSPNKEEKGYLDKTMDVAGEVWGGLSGLDKAALLTSPVPIVGDIVGGVADAKALYDDPSLVNLAMMAAGLIPFVPSGGVTRTAQKAFTNLRNDIPGFYETNNPVKQGLSWAKTLPEGVGNIAKARYSPESRAIQEEFNISVADQKAARNALKLNEEITLQVAPLKKELQVLDNLEQEMLSTGKALTGKNLFTKKGKIIGPEYTKEYKDLLKIMDETKDQLAKEIKPASTAAKQAMGQLNQSRSMTKQYYGASRGIHEGLLKNIDEIDHIKTFNKFNVDDYFDTVGDLSWEDVGKEDIQGIFKQISKVQRMNPKKTYQMNIRRTHTQSAGTTDHTMSGKIFKTIDGKEVNLNNIKESVFSSKKPYTSDKKFLESLEETGLNILNPNEVLKGRAAIITGSGKTDAWELGGVNYMTAINKKGKVTTIVNDEHDLFGTPARLQKVIKTDSIGKLPGADRYMNVSSPLTYDLINTKKMTPKQKAAKKKLDNRKKEASKEALERYESIDGVNIKDVEGKDLPVPLGFGTKEQWARAQAVANLKPTSKDYSKFYKDAKPEIAIPVRASKPLLREEEEETIPQRKRGGSVVERNPYNYTAKAI
jgi:hypothetical protein